ncbi:MAG: hypothetical protein JW801_07805 [Bacteroidales bacterium]|nr:hypothetical protein [Bacteroidales bacterium]
MKLIIPMAGLGKRMRPHTLLTPKPLLRLAGKSIVHRIIEGFAQNSGRKVTEVHFVVGMFGKEVEEELIGIAKTIEAEGFIHYQELALGTAHAVYCAKAALTGEVCIAFADTLYVGSFEIGDNEEALIWTYAVKDANSYGVVVTNDKDEILDFIEKPSTPVSKDAIVGLYYFKDGSRLREGIRELIEGDHRVRGEFQLTDCLQNLAAAGLVFKKKGLKAWLDFGSVPNFLKSAGEFLCLAQPMIDIEENGVKIIPPVWIGVNAFLENCIIGPNVIIDNDTVVKNSNIGNSVIGRNTIINRAKLTNSFVGGWVSIENCIGELNIGDYNEIKGVNNMAGF